MVHSRERLECMVNVATDTATRDFIGAEGMFSWFKSRRRVTHFHFRVCTKLHTALLVVQSSSFFSFAFICVVITIIIKFLVSSAFNCLLLLVINLVLCVCLLLLGSKTKNCYILHLILRLVTFIILFVHSLQTLVASETWCLFFFSLLFSSSSRVSNWVSRVLYRLSSSFPENSVQQHPNQRQTQSRKHKHTSSFCRSFTQRLLVSGITSSSPLLFAKLKERNVANTCLTRVYKAFDLFLSKMKSLTQR